MAGVSPSTAKELLGIQDTQLEADPRGSVVKSAEKQGNVWVALKQGSD